MEYRTLAKGSPWLTGVLKMPVQTKNRCHFFTLPRKQDIHRPYLPLLLTQRPFRNNIHQLSNIHSHQTTIFATFSAWSYERSGNEDRGGLVPTSAKDTSYPALLKWLGARTKKLLVIRSRVRTLERYTIARNSKITSLLTQFASTATEKEKNPKNTQSSNKGWSNKSFCFRLVGFGVSFFFLWVFVFEDSN